MTGDIPRRYWPLWALAVGLLVITAAFGSYLTDRQHIADTRNEKQRQAICAILANIPGHVPVEIQKARQVFASHAGECHPIKGAVPAPTTIHVTINGQPKVVVVNPTTRPQPKPASSRTAKPQPSRSPRPTPTHTPKPSPSPTPSPTCSLHRLVTDPTSCLHL